MILLLASVRAAARSFPLTRSGAVALALFLLAPLGTATVPLAAQDAGAARRALGNGHSLAVDYSYAHFGVDTDPWHLASVSLGRQTGFGSVLARASYAERFATGRTQVEIDAYPRLPGSTYAYLNAGYAPAGLFPTWRLGGELYANLPGAWELSGGVRELRFDSSHVTLFTGSVGRYVGNYWFSARPFVRAMEGGLSASASLTARRYFADADHFVDARVGYGSTPVDRIGAVELERTTSWSAAVHGSRRVRGDLFGTASLGYDREQLGVDRFRDRVELAAGLRVDF